MNSQKHTRKLQNWGGQGTFDSVSIREWFIVCTSCSLLCGRETEMSLNYFHRLPNLTPECSNLLTTSMMSHPPPSTHVGTLDFNRWILGRTNVQSVANTTVRKRCEDKWEVCAWGSVSIYTSGWLITHRGAVVWAPGVTPGHTYLLAIRCD